MNRFDGLVINAVGEAIPACEIFVCTQPNSIDPDNPSIPPSPLASLFTDSTGSTPLANPVTADGNGNFFFYATSGIYTLVYFDPYGRIDTQVFLDQPVLTPGGGSVNSVGLTAPDGLAVTGSPVSSSGNLALAYSTDWGPGIIVIGPSSGAASAPSRRRLVAADIAGLAGGVSSVNASVSPGALFSALFTGGPITGSGVLSLTFDLNPQQPNTFLGGPASGGLGAVTARKLQPADLPPMAAVAFSGTPSFDGSINSCFRMTLTGNVTVPTFVNGVPGALYAFIIKQDGTGGRIFNWPVNVNGGGVIDPSANSTNVQLFVWDGAALQAVTSMMSEI